MGSQSIQKLANESSGSEDTRSARFRGMSSSVQANSLSQTSSRESSPGRLGIQINVFPTAMAVLTICEGRNPSHATM